MESKNLIIGIYFLFETSFGVPPPLGISSYTCLVPVSAYLAVPPHSPPLHLSSVLKTLLSLSSARESGLCLPLPSSRSHPVSALFTTEIANRRVGEQKAVLFLELICFHFLDNDPSPPCLLHIPAYLLCSPPPLLPVS